MLILPELKSSAAGLVDNERERQIAHPNGHSDKTKHTKKNVPKTSKSEMAKWSRMTAKIVALAFNL